MSSAPLLAPLEERSAQLDRALFTAFLRNIPDRVFFKDRRSRFVAVSESCVRAFGGATVDQILGRTDFDFFSAAHARLAYDEEQAIMRTGEPVLNKIEREVWLDRRVTWSLTSKVPLRDETGEIIGTFGLSKDITRTREMELALEKAHKELVDASRMAGMAEVANGVLHNVGNVLNSLNVSASVITMGLRQSKAESLRKVAALLRENQHRLAEFLTSDPKGRRLPELIASLARHAVEERDRLVREIRQLQKNIDHIKEIVSMQQTYATMIGVVEPLDPVTAFEDALRMSTGAFVRHEAVIERDFQFVPPVLGEKAKVLQILVNLIRNAKHACNASDNPEKRVTLRIHGSTTTDTDSAPADRVDRVRFIVEDNGVGIPPENLTRIFGHGFTTRPDGHGFGLHSAANAAREMKGTLTVHSRGLGLGATFILDLPAAPPAVPAT